MPPAAQQELRPPEQTDQAEHNRDRGPVRAGHGSVTNLFAVSLTRLGKSRLFLRNRR